MSAEDKKVKYVSEEYLVEEMQGDSSSLDTTPKSGWAKFIEFIAVQKKGDLTTSQMFLYNHDLRPVEEQRRQWSWYNYVFFWVADSFNVNTWQIAATGIQAGMNWWQTWLSVWIGYILCGIFVSIGARVGILYHISFPVAARSSFGIYGSLWPIFNRVFMSAVWYSVQGWIGGQCVQLMLQSIFSNLPVKLGGPIQGGVTTQLGFLGYFLFWLFSLPAIWFQPHQIRHLFTFKAYVVPFAGIGFLIWTLVKAHGIGPVISETNALKGSALGWAFVQSTLNSLANFATLITNAPDFSRFADKPSFSMKYLVHTVSIPLCFSITSLIGILVSSASASLYGEVFWSPLDVLGQFLNNYNLGNRAGVFFISFAFALAQLGTNISANSLSFGTDCTALLPRFMNIRRGGYLCAAIALAICPWNLFTSSSRFTTYLSAYSVFLSSIVGVTSSDYFYVRRGYLKLTHLYSLHAPEEPSAPSFYKYGRFGVNWRAYVAYICGILPNIVGFVGATGTHKVPIGATKVYYLNFFMGFFSAGIIYALLCYISPPAGIPQVKPFEKGWFEEWQDVEEFEQEITGGLVAQTSALEKTLSYEGGRKRHV